MPVGMRTLKMLIGDAEKKCFVCDNTATRSFQANTQDGIKACAYFNIDASGRPADGKLVYRPTVCCGATAPAAWRSSPPWTGRSRNISQLEDREIYGALYIAGKRGSRLVAEQRCG